MGTKSKITSAKERFKILIIEDEPGFRRTYSDLLAHFGHEVIEAADGEKGAKAVVDGNPDLVLLDLIMPKLNGYEVLQKIRQNPATANLPVIIFSVLGEQADIQKALDMGANDYIIKGSYTPTEVLRKLGKFLASSSVTDLNT